MVNTPNLNLPQYQQQDKFEVDRMNSGFLAIDTKWKELDDFRTQLPLVNANAELIEGRQGATKLVDNLNKIRNDSLSLIDYAKRKKILCPTGGNLADVVASCITNNADLELASNGTYTLSATLTIPTGINVYGNGATINANTTFTGESVIKYSQTVVGAKGTMRDLIIKAIPTVVALTLDKSHNCLIDNVKCYSGLKGIFLTGTVGVDFNLHCSTNTISRCVTYDCVDGIYIDTAGNDNNISDCNFGYCNTPVFVNGGSNHFNNCVMWGSKVGRGVYVNGQQTYIRNCNIEGNKQEGVTFTEYSSFSTVDNCKFMSNGRQAKDMFNHIYIAGSSANLVKNVSINNCKFLGSSGNADGDGQTIRAIGMEATHEGVAINNCTFMYNTTGTVYDLAKAQVFGLQAKDMVNGVQITTNDKREYWQLNPSELCHDSGSGYMYYANPVTKKIVTMATPYTLESGYYKITVYPNSLRKLDGTYVTTARLTAKIPTTALPVELSPGENGLYRRYSTHKMPTGINFGDDAVVTSGCTHWQVRHNAQYYSSDNSLMFCTSSEVQAYAQLSNANHYIYFVIEGEVTIK